MKPREIYSIIFNELFDTASRLEEAIGYCESDLETSIHLGRKADIDRYTEELSKTKERFSKVQEAMQFSVRKFNIKTT